jgi:hypothetical protein
LRIAANLGPKIPDAVPKKDFHSLIELYMKSGPPTKFRRRWLQQKTLLVDSLRTSGRVAEGLTKRGDALH